MKFHDDAMKACVGLNNISLTHSAGWKEDNELLSFVDSLQQDFPITDEQVKEFLAAHPKIEVPNKYKTPDWLFKKQEQPSSDLDEAAEKYADKEYPDEASCGQWGTGDYEPPVDMEYPREVAKDSFKAGAEWQYQKDREEFAKIKAKTWCEGFDAHKEQMLKDAVEADVNTYIDLAAGKSWAEFVVRMPTKELGDKVRMVIIKEDE